ncbi:hypothetical protein [Arsenicicoccus sp. oral taxon 190]|uniref:hypothetical protein n=1 Tax=Arsenicicoccus sp. oral taxon 190 TaxID=1658671 RepID=UPI00067A335C|nr:hypothetical protein [Arsenicicoccus sp. oral taxon 190]AKT50121.1 hypothetical protein ADJ73_00045 [Arsenicicoccus sp. oral taxon 190]
MSIAFLVLHYLSLAVLVFGYVQSIERGAATTLMAWGARLQLLTGLLLVMAAEMAENANHTFIGIKLVVMLAVLGLTEVSHARGRRGETRPLLVHLAAALVLVNVVVAYTMG